MKFTVHKNKHRFLPLRFGLYWNKYALRRKVYFYPSCKYDLPGVYDDEDYDKLFGIGYLAFHWPMHHVDSARFGWYFSPNDNRIVIAAYCYVGGQRIMIEMCKIITAWPYIFELIIDPDFYRFKVIDSGNNKVVGEQAVPRYTKKRLGFFLGLYFGGNEPAPNDMSIEMKKL